MKSTIIFLIFILTACGNTEVSKNNSENTTQLVQARSVNTSVEELKNKFQPIREDALYKLENEIMKRKTDAANFPRSSEMLSWTAEIDELKIERDEINSRLSIEKKYLSDLLSNAKENNVKAEIQRTTGREIEKKTLEYGKRLAEIERDIKDLNYNLKSKEIEIRTNTKLNQVEAESLERQAELQNKINEKIEKQNKRMEKNLEKLKNQNQK